jgi:hypothetical protein
VFQAVLGCLGYLQVLVLLQSLVDQLGLLPLEIQVTLVFLEFQLIQYHPLVQALH